MTDYLTVIQTSSKQNFNAFFRVEMISYFCRDYCHDFISVSAFNLLAVLNSNVGTNSTAACFYKDPASGICPKEPTVCFTALASSLPLANQCRHLFFFITKPVFETDGICICFELFCFRWHLNFKLSLTNVLLFNDIIRNKSYVCGFCGFYRCVNSGE